MADAVPPSLVLNNMPTYGTQLIGGVFSSALWGISCMQLFLYFLNYEKDHWRIKAFVVFLWSLDTIIEAMTFAGLFPVLVTKWGSLNELMTVRPLIIHRTYLAFVLAFSVQMWFLRRIYKFTGGKGLRVRAGIIAIVVVAFWPIVGIIIYTKIVLSDNSPIPVVLSRHEVVALSLANRATSAATDIAITLWMTLLLTDKSRSAFRQTNRLVYRMILITINTGAWTALVALIDFSLLAWNNANLGFTLCEFPLASLYLNMCLVSLNARRYLRGGDNSWCEPEFSRNDSAPRGTGPIPLRHMNGSATLAAQEDSVAIRIDTSMTMKSDVDQDSLKMTKVNHDAV